MFRRGAALLAAVLTALLPTRVMANEPPGAQADGLLFPVQNQLRGAQELSGPWELQFDPRDEGETNGWALALPAARPTAVPSSWNDLYDDARNYFGTAWYRTEAWAPASWKGQRLFLRVGSANYAAKVWVNGRLVARHEGGHLPFVADVTDGWAWDRANVIAIAVENEQRPDRVPHAPSPAGGLMTGVMAPYPATTHDFFPYSGLHRPVLLFSVPPEHIDDVTVVTTIDGADGVVSVRVRTAVAYSGSGTARLAGIETGLTFRDGVADVQVRVPGARLWSPADPHLYPLTVTLEDEGQVTDAYSLDIGIRTIAVDGDRLLLNGEPITLRGFGKHEDSPFHGRATNQPLLIRDHELLAWVGASSCRTAHYPHSEEAMRLADRLGVLIIDEIPAVSLNFADGEELLAQRLQQCERQLREMIARDKNHPSVVLWCVLVPP